MAQPSPHEAAPLAEGYYADNFQTVLETVVQRYGDLLSADEQRFAEDFQKLPCGARRLYVRLVSRKGPLFRRDRLHYPEIGPLDTVLATLIDAGFADTGHDAPVESCVSLLLRDELGTLWRELLGTPPPTRRAERLAGLCTPPAGTRDDSHSALRRAISARIRIVRPVRLSSVTTFQLLFFGTLHQDWTAFVLRDLGVVRHEPYPLDATPRRFRERRAIDHALLLWDRRRHVEDSLQQGDLEHACLLVDAIARPRQPWHPVTARLADRIVNQVARQLERAGQPHRALVLFETSDTPPARERRARLLAQLDRREEALALCMEIAEAPRDEQERAFADLFASRLAQRRRTRRSIPRLEMTLARHGDARVEHRVLEALASTGKVGFFAENWLWKSLFGLAFWDILFAPIPGAFEHPFQLGPADLHEPSFRTERAALIDQRLAWLRATPQVAPFLLRVFDQKEGTANSMVSWHPGARSALALALGRLRGGHLAAVCDRLSRDVRRYRRGFPDLFVITDRWPGFALYEVKAPGDQIRAEQRSWIHALNRATMNAAVLNVAWR